MDGHPHSARRLFVLGGEGFEGGTGSYVSFDQVSSYNPATDTWHLEPLLQLTHPTSVPGFVYDVFGPAFHLVGGWDYRTGTHANTHEAQGF